ncbi:hypothetical protein HDV00_011964 [Rhizophlyctis rosea]|nr:hypothetical protein HDV00_011964 [Rhizophlyctis rosea]
MAGSFLPKTSPIDWDRILEINVDDVLQDSGNADEQLEELYPALATAQVRLDDPRATPANLLHLFRLTQAAMELKNMYLEEAEEQIQDLDTTLRNTESELNRQRAAALGGDSYGAEIRSLREDISELERRNEALTKDVTTAETALDAERRTVQELGLAVGNEKVKVVTLEDDVKRLKGEIQHYVVQLNNQKDRLQSKTVDEDQFRNQLKDKNTEINRYVAEVQILSAENAQLHDEIDTMAQELEATVLEIERTGKEQEEAQEIIVQNDRMIDRLTEERDAIKQKLHDLSAQLASGGSRDEKLLEEMHKEIRSQKNTNRDLKRQLHEKDEHIQRLSEDLETSREEIRYFNINAMKKLISEKDEQIQALNDKLSEVYHDFELLSVDWDQLDKALKHQHTPETDTTRAHLTAVAKLKEKIDVYKSRHRDDVSKMRQIDGQLEGREKELLELREMVERYERGEYGLQEAVREIKEEKLQKRMREKDIVVLTEKTNDLQCQIDELLEENEELRRRLGIDTSIKIDLSLLRSKRAIELEQAQSLNMELQKEIDRLEEERLQFKKAMRLHALERGGRAAQLGLTAAELAEMEDYAEFLRTKGKTRRTSGVLLIAMSLVGPSNGGVTIVQMFTAGGAGFGNLDSAQFDKLALELERAQVNAEESRVLANKAQSRLEEISKENAALEAAIKEVSATLVRLMQNGKSDGKKSITLPIVEQLVELIESKLRQEQSRRLQSSQAEQDVIGVTQALRIELQEEKRVAAEMKATLERIERESTNVREERNVWKERAIAPRRRILDLPAELSLGNMQDYSSLVEQLVQSLSDQERLDKELTQTKTALEKYATDYGLLAQKQHLLYRDLQTTKETHALEIQQSQRQLKEAVAAKDDAILRMKELELIAEAVHMGPDDVKRNLVETQRRLIVLLTNEKSLTRRYLAMVEVENGLRKEVGRLKSDMAELDRTAKETIGRLQRYKNAARQEVEDLQQQLSESVPMAEHESLEAQLQLSQTKIRSLLEWQSKWISEKENLETEMRRNRELKERLERAEADLFEARSNATKMEAALGRLARGGQNQASGSAQLVVEAEQRATCAEVRLEVAQHRAATAEKKAAELTAAESELRKRLEALDQMYLEAQEENLRLRGVELKMQHGLEGYLSKEEHDRIKQHVAQLEKQVVKLKEEVAKYKNISDIAMSQAADIAHMQAADAKEKDILRAAIRELQMEGEDKLLIGKLHHHILALQVSETAALRKLETALSKCMKLEGTVVQLENAMEENHRIIFQMRMDHKKRLRYLQHTVIEMRIQLGGAVKLERHERTCDLVRHLKAQTSKLKAEADAAHVELLDCQGKSQTVFIHVAKRQGHSSIDTDTIAHMTLQLEQQTNLVATLRGNSPANQRIVAWHTKLSDLQLSNLRLERQLARESAARSSVESEARLIGENIGTLEEKLAHSNAALDARQLEWELRQNELEMTIQKLEEERDRIYQAATAAELKQILPDRSLPIGQQLETSLRLLVERSRICTAQEMTISNLEGKISVLEHLVEETGQRLLQTNKDVTKLRLEVSKHDMEKKDQDEIGAIKMTSISRRREDQTIRTAQESIKSLQTQLLQKGELVEKYQAMVKELRDDMLLQKERHKAELAGKVVLLNKLNDREITHISKLPQARADREGDNLSPPHVDDVERLEKVMQAKDVEISSLKGRVQQLGGELEEERRARKAELDRFTKDNEEKTAAIEEQLKRVEDLNTQIQTLQEKVEHQSPELLENIAKLKHELDLKTVKHANLQKVVQKVQRETLRSKMQEAAEDVAQKKIRVDHDRYDLQQMVEARTATLNTKVNQLEAKMQRLSKQAEEHRLDEAEMEEDMKRLSAEIAKREETIAKQTNTLERAQKQMHTLEVKTKRLREERDHFKRALEDMTLSQAKGTEAGSEHESRPASRAHSAASRHVLDENAEPVKADAVENKQPSRPTSTIAESIKKEGAKNLEMKLPADAQKVGVAIEGRLHSEQIFNRESDATKSISKWELEKKLNRRIENLKKRLAEKTEECDGAQRTLASFKETITRSEHDRLRLQHKVNTLSSQLASAIMIGQTGQKRKNSIDVSGRGMSRGASWVDSPASKDSQDDAKLQQIRSQADTILSLQSRIHELEAECDAQKRKLDITTNADVTQTQHETKQLKERLKIVEELNDQLRRSKGVFPRGGDEESIEMTGMIDTSAKIGDRSQGLVGVLESRIRDLMNKYQALETEKIQKEREIIETKSAKEQAEMARQRLLRKITELEQYIQTVKESQAAAAATQSPAIPSLPVPLSSLLTARTTLSNRSTSELLAVIEHLSRAMDKLRSDVKRRNRPGSAVPSQAKYMELVKELKKLKKEREEMEYERKAVQNVGKTIAKVEEENTKLRRSLRIAQSAQSKWEIERDQLVQELSHVKQAVSGAWSMQEDEEEAIRNRQLVKDLRMELTERNEMIQKLLDPAKEVSSGLASENRRLTRELEMWRARATKLTEQMATESMPSRKEVPPDGEAGRHELEKEIHCLREQLSKFTPNLLEELEDLRHNYRECMELNVRYEATVRALCGRLGIAVEDVLIQAGIHTGPGSSHR